MIATTSQLSGQHQHLILRYYDVMSANMLAARLNVSKEAVAEFGRKHNCAFATNPAWFKDEVAYLEKFHTTKTPAEISERLGRSRISVELKMKEMGLPQLVAHREWTKAEDRYLEEHINNQPLEKTAAKLHRSKDLVLSRARKLGISTLDSIVSFSDLQRRWGVTRKAIEECIENGLPFETLKVLGKKYRVIDRVELDKWCAEHVQQLAKFGVVVATAKCA